MGEEIIRTQNGRSVFIMLPFEIKNKVADICVHYDGVNSIRRMSSTINGRSCDICSNFIGGRCINSCMESRVKMLKNN